MVAMLLDLFKHAACLLQDLHHLGGILLIKFDAIDVDITASIHPHVRESALVIEHWAGEWRDRLLLIHGTHLPNNHDSELVPVSRIAQNL